MTVDHLSAGHPPIRAVTFDLDDTLWDIWPVIARAEERLHDWLSSRYPRIPAAFSPIELRELGNAIGMQQPAIAHDKTRLRKEALRRAAAQCGYEDFEVEPAFEVFFLARNEVVLFEEVLPVLERLQRRFLLGTLSNGNADIRLIGLSHLFDFSLNAIDVGAAKPEPALFEAACRFLQLPPAQIVHVGDDPEHDVLGARQAGLRTVWVNRNSREWPGGPGADAEIQTLEDLERLLEHWNPPDRHGGTIDRIKRLGAA